MKPIRTDAIHIRAWMWLCRNWLMVLVGFLLIIGGIAFAIALPGCQSGASTETSAPSAMATLTEERMKYDESGKPMEKITTTKSGQATGTGMQASGDKIDQAASGQPASVSLDDVQASGGGGQSKTKATAEMSAMKSPLLWVGILCILGAAFCLYKAQIRAGLCLVAAGGGLIASAFYPALMIFACAGAVAVIAGPYIWAEIQRHRKTEALRAVVGGIAAAPTDAQDAVKVEIAKQAEPADEDVITKVKRKDGLA